ncbi:conserved protein of unknown function [Ectopseudomonas oleovorans]|uniref:Uncharacterized protein n=1 Tax=Ectopseudomonas oleovorans TaxID=301 RepID=A0A653B4G3_ECTOL|nr:conserved protein of unknown function [Pseudomonas oleovorans]
MPRRKAAAALAYGFQGIKRRFLIANGF